MNRSKAVLILLAINGLIFAICFAFFWLPKGRELAENLETLSLLEYRYSLKENNLKNYELNLKRLEELNTVIKNGSFILLHEDEILPALANIKEAAVSLGLTETAFYAGEPETIETSAYTVIALKAVATYGGDYNELLKMAKALVDSPCYVESVSVSKTESSISASLIFYGIAD